MQWSKYLPREIAKSTVLEFVPQKIDLGTPGVAMDYVRSKPGSDFRMNEQVQVTTGVDKIEQAGDEEKSEKRALELLTEIQEKAYKEAYQLGLDEGQKRAFEENSTVIKEKLDHFTEVLSSLDRIKGDIVAHNETHMVTLLYHMASRIAMTHLENNSEAIVNVMKSAISLAQDEENIKVQMNPEQIEFLEELRKKTDREFEFLKKIQFEPDPKIAAGGCIVETNYGEIDARVETRLQQLWETLSETLPKVKNKITG